MPVTGVPSPPRPASHTSTHQWQSFEIRMRRRRAERCMLRAQVALEAGFVDDAVEALEEARRLDPASPEIETLEQQIAAAPAAATGEVASAAPRLSGVRIALVASVLALGGALALQPWRAAPDAAPPPRPAQSDVVLPPAPRVTPVVRSVVVPAATVREESRPAATTEPSAPQAEPLPRVAEPPAATPVATSGGAPPPPASAPAVAVESGIPAAAMPATASTRVEAPPPPPAVDEGARVRAVLARYEAAYSGLDASAARRVWPAVDQGALERAFDALATQRLSLGRCDLAVIGATARADCSGTASWTPKVGGGSRTESRRWQFELAKTGDDWQIVSAVAR